MAIRTNEDAVAKLMAPGKDYDGKSDLAPFIVTANSHVNWVQANAAAYGRTAMSAADAELVERWLAAWAYKMSDQQLQSSNAGRSSASFKGQSAMGFSANNYGQTALTLDRTGLLRAMDEGRIVGVDWIGKVPTEQTDYVNRR